MHISAMDEILELNEYYRGAPTKDSESNNMPGMGRLDKVTNILSIKEVLAAYLLHVYNMNNPYFKTLTEEYPDVNSKNKSMLKIND
jgi:hypothetical protein